MLSVEITGAVLAGTHPEGERAPERSLSLVERLRAGDQDAYEFLVRNHGPAIHRVAYRVLGDSEEAREVTQETFLKVYRNIHRFRGETGLLSWMIRIALNQAANHRRWWRRRKRDETFSLTGSGDGDGQDWSERIADGSANPEEERISQESRRVVALGLAGVTMRFRIALVLRDIEGYSYDQISTMLSVSIGTVKSRIARGRAQLKREVERLGWRSTEERDHSGLTGSDPKKTSPMGQVAQGSMPVSNWLKDRSR